MKKAGAFVAPAFYMRVNAHFFMRKIRLIKF